MIEMHLIGSWRKSFKVELFVMLKVIFILYFDIDID